MASRILVKRAIVVGALAFSALAAPTYAALSTAPAAHADPNCTAWFGSRTNGKCIAYSLSGQGSVLNGVPITVNGPTTGNPGLQTGPMLPGRTISQPIG